MPRMHRSAAPSPADSDEDSMNLHSNRDGALEPAQLYRRGRNDVHI